MFPCWAPRWVGPRLMKLYNYIMATYNLVKRRRGDSSDSDDLDMNWPRFLVMEGTDDKSPLSKLSPFAIAKGIKGLAGEPKSVKVTSQGLLIEVEKKAHSDNLLRSTEIANIPILVTAHKTLNTCRGVVRCKELAGLDEEEIQSELSGQQVTAVKRIFIDKGTRATNTYILTFGKTSLPSTIKAGYLRLKVTPYIPNPLRCFKCQAYGHGTNKCTKDVRCSRCGEGHASEVCTADEPFCIHCRDKHTASDRTCPKYLKEKEIQRLKFTENISFPEARRRVESSTSSVQYSTIVKGHAKTPTTSISVQTCLTWPLQQDSPTFISAIDPDNTDNPSATTQTTITAQPTAKPPPSDSDKSLKTKSHLNISRGGPGGSARPAMDHPSRGRSSGSAGHSRDPSAKALKGGSSRSVLHTKEPSFESNKFSALERMDTEDIHPPTPRSPVVPP